MTQSLGQPCEFYLTAVWPPPPARRGARPAPWPHAAARSAESFARQARSCASCGRAAVAPLEVEHGLQAQALALGRLPLPRELDPPDRDLLEHEVSRVVHAACAMPRSADGGTLLGASQIWDRAWPLGARRALLLAATEVAEGAWIHLAARTSMSLLLRMRSLMFAVALAG